MRVGVVGVVGVVGAGRRVEVWGCIGVRLVEVRRPCCREGQDGKVRGVFRRAVAILQRQQLGSQAAVLLQQAPVVFLIGGDELSFATRVVAGVLVAAAASLRFSVGEALFVFEGEGVTQEGSGQLARGSQDGNSLASEGQRLSQRPGLWSLHSQQRGH
ncbi:hypothetical protein EYF80_031796 [Liparis tanakae]|uniref:Uncharacterized protein n=1 Tax=Liparis tanakae TaxID=230148 RepID=A0A4Z2GZ87_9TELE|nr:hypothetical protein EYF80_031796 [Liparis tanakae]